MFYFKCWQKGGHQNGFKKEKKVQKWSKRIRVLSVAVACLLAAVMFLRVSKGRVSRERGCCGSRELVGGRKKMVPPFLRACPCVPSRF
jgi:hypothetical protein